MRLTTAVLTFSLTVGLIFGLILGPVGCDETPARVVADADITDDATLDALHPPREAGSDAGPGDAAPGVDAPKPDSGWPASYTPPTQATVLTTLKSGHPRLIVLPADLARIKSDIAADPVAKGYRDALIKRGDKMLGEAVSKRVLVGPRLLAVSRKVLDRVYTLALLHRLTGEAKYFKRARDELVGVAAFSDWNPSHFLDVAEMTHAFAIGYDWLYGDLSASERATIKKAIVELGLKPAQKAYNDKAWWVTSDFNWNNVCNGGILVGALAVADEEPTLAAFLAHKAVTNLPKALATYAPDGAWAEGPGYWGYATRYSVAAFAALKSALGTDFGLSSMPGLAKAGLFRMSVTGPSKKFFNYADCGESAGSDASLFWLGRRYNRPLYAWGERSYAGTSGKYGDLIWYDDRGTQADLLKESPDAWFKGPEVVVLRGSWTDPDATFVGFKGGDNAANHAHLDLGTFVLDALGQRWAMELAGDNYNLPDYFGSKRWTYYRLKTEGQNTLVWGGVNQETKATAAITLFSATAKASCAITDLTKAYTALGAKRVWRGVALLADRQRVLIVDEVEATKAADLVWGMHTRASIAIAGQTATLTAGGKKLTLQVLDGGAAISQSSVNLAAPRNPTTGITKLKLKLKTLTSGTLRLSVLFTPEGGPTTAVKARPLAEWKGKGPTQ